MRTLSVLFFLTAVLCVLVPGAAVLHGQAEYGQIDGLIKLENGSTIPGVLIEVTADHLLKKRQTVTNQKGIFYIHGLASGLYKLTISQDGYKTIVMPAVMVTLGESARLDVVLTEGEARETVTQEANVNVVQTAFSEADKTFPKEVSKRLPNYALDMFTFAQLTPGARNEPLFGTLDQGEYDNGRGSSLSVDGASASENTYYIDGIDTTDMESGISGINLHYDFIDDVQVKRSGLGVEYAGGTGAVINVVTRSGKGRLHGELGVRYGADGLSGKPQGLLTFDPNDYSKALYSDAVTDKWTQLDPSFSLGGAIMKDKLWFFTALMPQTHDRTRTIDFYEAGAANRDYEYKDTRFNFMGKVSWALAESLRAGLNGYFNNRTQDNRLPSLRRSYYSPDSMAANYGDFGWKEPAAFISGYMQYTVGTSGVFTLSGSHYRTNGYFDGAKSVPVTRVAMAADNAHLFGADDDPDLIKEANWSNVDRSDIQEDLRDIQSKSSVKGDFKVFFSYAGAHALKFGFHWNRLSMDKYLSGTSVEEWLFYWKQPNGVNGTYTSVTGQEIETTYGYVAAMGPSGVMGTLKNNRLAFYVQDSWNPTDNLTVDLGIRLEKDNLPSMSSIYTGTPFTFSMTDRLAPRIGFVYDIGGKGTSKFFGSAGLYYDTMKMDLAVAQFGGYGSVVTYYDIATLDWTQYLGQKGYRFSGSKTAVAEGDFLESVEISSDSFGKVQPGIKPTSKLEITLGYSTQLTKDLTFTAHLLHNRLYNVIETFGVQVDDEFGFFVANPGSQWLNDLYEYSAERELMPAGITSPKAKREYYAMTISLDKRFGGNWMGGLALTLSSLKGNYSGLGSSDVPGAQTPNVLNQYNSWYSPLDSRGNVVEGRLPTDRPVEVKFYGAYSFDFGLTLGFSGFAASGTPVSRSIQLNSTRAWYPDGRMTDGRTPFIWQLDLYAEYNLKLGNRLNLNLNANVANVTNNKTARRVFNGMYPQLLSLTEEQIYQGFDIDQLFQSNGMELDPRFLKEYDFMAPIAVRLGAKLSF